MKQDLYGLGYKLNAKVRRKMKRERTMANLEGAIVEGEHMVFLQLHETFYSAGVEYDDIRPSETTVLRGFEELIINVVEGIEMKKGGYKSHGVPTFTRSCTNELDYYRYSYSFLSFTLINKTLHSYLSPKVKSIFYV